MLKQLWQDIKGKRVYLLERKKMKILAPQFFAIVSLSGLIFFQCQNVGNNSESESTSFLEKALTPPEELRNFLKEYDKELRENVNGPANALGDRWHILEGKINNDGRFRTGKPCPVFAISAEKVKNLDLGMPVDSFVDSVGGVSYYIPIWCDNSVIYFIEVIPDGQQYSSPSGWHVYSVGREGGEVQEWQQVREAWPEEGAVDPVMIGFNQYRMLHFPAKGGHNLTFLWGDIDSAGFLIKRDSYIMLDSSKKTLEQIRKKLLARSR